ncbi:hypothetical protein GC101_20105 [Paenibacillus sp. LMG 31459]|uniref:DUF7678 domain-containing protein n=1 Tax=Paenibacillus phytohabitans TaxID=2654978 RepID=A0ABX1YN09_9BACL|nr:hypothetical protein [Paenibacillus phytohabitans]NOU81170.1 hypothetical protein [Paenibacillus phytohabitans]
MPLEYKRPLYTGDIFEGEIEGFFVKAHVFSEPSSYGIAKGRISRLTVYPNKQKVFSLANFERGWDGKPPEDIMIRAVIAVAVEQFDNKAVDWTFEATR